MTFNEPVGTGEGGKGGPCGCPVPDHIRKPSGCVTVEDNMLRRMDPVRRVKVITARDALGLFFSRSDETDDKGCWAISRKYHGNIHVWVKFKSDYCAIRTMAHSFDFLGYGLIKKAYKGSFGGPNFNNLEIKFLRNTTIGSAACTGWLAATDNNALHEYRDWCSGEGITLPPLNLDILVAPWQDGSGATVMLNHMPGFTATLTALGGPAVMGVFGVYNNPAIAPLYPIIAPWLAVFAPDIVLNVNNPERLNSDQIKEVVYHELGHSSHWMSAGSGYWQSNILYVAGITTAPPFNDAPYGDGTNSGAGRCAVIESWGYHIGATVAGGHYGINSSCYGMQNVCFYPSNTQSSYITALESFDPNYIPDGNRWIPKGVFNDLVDNANEIGVPVVDSIGGFTQASLFSTLNVASVASLKSNILAITPASQAPFVNTLFTSYNGSALNLVIA